jgi:hypothetical protein
MPDLSEKEYQKIYGLYFDKNGDERYCKNFELDYSDWYAVKSNSEYDNIDQELLWYFVPKKFWDMNKYIPDSCLGHEIPGFVEACEHELEYVGEGCPKEAFKRLGVEIIEEPDWYGNTRHN